MNVQFRLCLTDSFFSTSSLEIGCKFYELKVFTGHPGRFLKVLCTFDLRPVSGEQSPITNLKKNNLVKVNIKSNITASRKLL